MLHLLLFITAHHRECFSQQLEHASSCYVQFISYYYDMNNKDIFLQVYGKGK